MPKSLVNQQAHCCKSFVAAKDYMPIRNIIDGGAIYQIDGQKKAVRGNFEGFQTYDHELIQIDGSTETLHIDEFKCVMAAFDGNIDLSPAGIRIANNKLMQGENFRGDYFSKLYIIQNLAAPILRAWNDGNW